MTVHDDADLTFTIREVADVLKVHPQTVRKLIRERALRAKQVKRCIRVTKRSLREYLDNESYDAQ